LYSVGNLLSDVCFNVGNNDTVDDDMEADSVDVLDYENFPTIQRTTILLKTFMRVVGTKML